MWRFVSPALLLAILAVTLADHKPTDYGGTVYPAWANLLGWFATLASISFVPIVALCKILRAEGSLLEVRKTPKDSRRKVRPSFRPRLHNPFMTPFLHTEKVLFCSD